MASDKKERLTPVTDLQKRELQKLLTGTGYFLDDVLPARPVDRSLSYVRQLLLFLREGVRGDQRQPQVRVCEFLQARREWEGGRVLFRDSGEYREQGYQVDAVSIYSWDTTMRRVPPSVRNQIARQIHEGGLVDQELLNHMVYLTLRPAEVKGYTTGYSAKYSVASWKVTRVE